MSSRKRVAATILFSLFTLLMGCDAALLDPKGPIGLAERDLIYVAVGLMLIVVLPAIFMALYFFWKYHETKGSEHLPTWAHSTKLEWIVWVVPIIIITILAIITWVSTHRLDPYKPIDHDKPAVNVQVISLDWKWLFIYPDYNIATVNEMAFPIDTPVAFKITSDTVMNSFFIPRLGTQIYTMAGMQTQLYLLADKPGRYKGISSGYSGHGFSDMKFTAIATKTDDDFKKWIAKVKKSPLKLLTDDEYNALAKAPTKAPYGHPVTYYSAVKPHLFQDTIDKFMDMGEHAHHSQDHKLENHQNHDMNHQDHDKKHISKDHQHSEHKAAKGAY